MSDLAEMAHDPMETPAVYLDIANCARCGFDHGAHAYKFKRPPPDATHYATCSYTNEPILVRFDEVTENEPEVVNIDEAGNITPSDKPEPEDNPVTRFIVTAHAVMLFCACFTTAVIKSCAPVPPKLPAHAAVPACKPCSWSPGDCGGKVSLCEQKPDGRLCCNKANP